MPIKILHIVPTYYPAVRYGGPIWSVHSLCRSLVERGHEVNVITTNVDGSGSSTVPLGVPVDMDGVKVWYFSSPIFRTLYWSGSMKRHLAQEIQKHDFVHLHSVFLWPTKMSARLAEKHGVPWCVAPRGALVRDLIKKKNFVLKCMWLSVFEKRTLEGAAFIHATTDLEKKEVLSLGFHIPAVEVIPNGVDLSIANTYVGPLGKSSERLQNSKFILFLGRISWKKGLDRLIPALKQIPGVDLVIAGNDEEELTARLRSVVSDLGIKDRVHFVGAIYGDEKARMLNAAQLLVLPSYSENFGNVVLESLAVGTAVAVTAEVGIAPMVKESGAGIIVPGDPVSMGKKISELLGSPAVLEEMGKCGRKMVEDSFSWETIGEKMENAYMRVLA